MLYESVRKKLQSKKENIDATLTTAEHSSDMIDNLKKKLQHEKIVLEHKHQVFFRLLAIIYFTCFCDSVIYSLTYCKL